MRAGFAMLALNHEDWDRYEQNDFSYPPKIPDQRPGDGSSSSPTSPSRLASTRSGHPSTTPRPTARPRTRWS